ATLPSPGGRKPAARATADCSWSAMRHLANGRDYSLKDLAKRTCLTCLWCFPTIEPASRKPPRGQVPSPAATLSVLPVGALSADTLKAPARNVFRLTAAGLNMKRSHGLVCVVPLVLALAACETSKSSNPLSATIAGPIPGVDISAPKLLEPNGERIAVDDQPVTLLIENASTNGPRLLTYAMEVAI